MTSETRNPIDTDFETFIERELAFCGYLVQPPLDALGAEEVETARRGLWEEWRTPDLMAGSLNSAWR